MQERANRRAGWKEWVGLAVLALPLLVLALDMSVLYLAAPHLGADLRPSGSQMLWILDIYGFMIAGFLVTMGTLGDRIGRRKLLMIGAVAFGAASVLAAYSTSAQMLIASRAVLGIAGATLMPSTLALISNMFRDPAQRAVAIGVWMTVFSAGVALGPLVGGALLEFFWWGSVFLIGAPVMALLLVLGPVLLPEYSDGDAGRLDLLSVALSLGAVLPIIYGLKKIAADGPHGLPVAAIAAGAIVGVVFVRRQRRLTSPLMDLRLFRNRAFVAALALILLGILALGGLFYLTPQFLQMVEGFSPLAAGLWMVPIAAANIVGSLLAPFVARRVRPAYVIAAGAAISAIGLLLVTQVETASGFATLIVGISVAAFGLGPMPPLSTDLVVGSAPPEKAGSASSLTTTCGELGTALGVALLGSLHAAVYRLQITGSISEDVPSEAAEAARDNLPAAVGAAEGLPAASSSELLDPAREAFVSGLSAVGVVSAAMLAALAVLAVVMLRHVRPSGEPEGGPGPEHGAASKEDSGTGTVPDAAPRGPEAAARADQACSGP